MKKGPTEKNSNLLHSQGMYYEYDGLKFKSKEELKSYVDSTKKNGKGISEEKTVEDAKATEEIAEADVIAPTPFVPTNILPMIAVKSLTSSPP